MKENVQPAFVTSSSQDPLVPSLNSSSGAPSSRPTSHHRRRSSVSTRRESAEMMGVSPAALSELPTADEGDVDSFHRRALWALEGKLGNVNTTNSFVGGYNKVEIPELGTPTHDTKFEIPLKTPFQLSNGPLTVKRDSFSRGLTPSVSSKDQLHTLVEEDEEEDETEEEELGALLKDQPVGAIQTKPGYNWKPLNLSATISGNPPTSRPGLKPLALATSPPLATSMPLSNRLIDMPKRRRSLSYKRAQDVTSSPCSSHGLTNCMPTPDLTPVTAERPMSPSEQAFLQSNQSSLLSRISELERVLTICTRTMSIGTASSRQLSVSSCVSDALSDEMLCLVRDLKAERDDLSRDVTSFQTKTEDLEKQISLLTRRVEHERRNAWEAKGKWERVELEKQKVQQELDGAHFEIVKLRQALEMSKAAETQLLLRLGRELTIREAADHDAERQSRTPRMRVDNFQSVPSIASFSSSTTEVELDIPNSVVALKAVTEEEEDVLSDGQDELAHYEDEGDDDIAAYSDDSFSDNNTAQSRISTVHPEARLGSLKPSTVSVVAPLPSPSSAGSSTPPPTPSPRLIVSHQRERSLDQEWSFPVGAQPFVRQDQEVDSFFDCLNFIDVLPDSTLFAPSFNDAKLLGKDKYGFFNEADDGDGDDDLPPFVIPSDAACISQSFDDIIEEDEVMHGFATTTAAVDSSCLKRKSPPALEARLPNVVHQDSKHMHSPDATSHPTFIPAANGTNSPRTPRRVQQSSIPRLSTSPASLAKYSALPVTPTSIPRCKGASNLVPLPRLTAASPRLVTPTKAYARCSTANAQSASSRSQAAASLKSPVSAFTALASYLPWAGWSDPRGTLSSNIDTRSSLSRQHSTTTSIGANAPGSAFAVKAGNVCVPQRKRTVPSQANGGQKDDGLVLL